MKRTASHYTCIMLFTFLLAKSHYDSFPDLSHHSCAIHDCPHNRRQHNHYYHRRRRHIFVFNIIIMIIIILIIIIFIIIITTIIIIAVVVSTSLSSPQVLPTRQLTL